MANKGRQKRTRKRFAVLMDIAVSNFQDEIKTGISKYAKSKGIDVIYFGLGTLDINIQEDIPNTSFLDMISKEEFDGVIIVSTSLINTSRREHLTAKLKSLSGLPMISIGPSLTGEPGIEFDGEYGTSILMNHLLEVDGYTRFAYVSGPLANPEAQIRFTAFKSTLSSAGIVFSDDWMFEGTFTSSAGYNAVKTLLDERGLNPEIIVCANDRMALGVWNSLSERGVNIPFDIALSGYDGNELSQMLPNYFTTVRQSFPYAAFTAADYLNRMIDGETFPERILLKGTLQIGNSCKCLGIEMEASSDSGIELIGEEAQVERRIYSFIEEGYPTEKKQEIYREWSKILGMRIRNGESLYELEAMLMRCNAIKLNEGTNLETENFLLSLNAMLKVERDRAYIAMHSVNHSLAAQLRTITEDLQNEIVESLEINGHDEYFKRILSVCRARTFHLLSFNSPQALEQGANLLFSTDAETGKSAWIPKTGSWFPDKEGSFVANMITVADLRYGYFLLDADIPDSSSFDYLRVRMNGLFRDFRSRYELNQMNIELHDQIKVRKNTELELKEALTLVKQLSIEDPLTGLHNRRGFMTLAEQQMKYLRRNNKGFFILYADLDGLKKINDQWGHNEGDIAIKAAAKVLSNILRNSDIIARIGGDEFTALIGNADEHTCEQIEQRILKQCAKERKAMKKSWILSMSMGFYYVQPSSKLSLTEIMEHADTRLYEKKKQRTGSSPGNQRFTET